MKYRDLGYTGEKISAVSLGCMGMSQGFGDPADKKEMVKLLHEALDLGVNMFDTAESYGPYENEKLLGEAFKDRRDRVFLATKCAMIPDGEGHYKIDASPESIRRSIEGSLVRLQTDYIDLYYLHRIDPNVPIEAVAELMKTLKEEGKIRYWGVSEARLDDIKKAHAIFPLAAVESEYNMMWRDVEKEVLPYLKQQKIALVPFSPLARGFMTGTINKDTKFSANDNRSRYSRFTPEIIEANQKLIDLVNSFAEKYSCTTAQITLAWLLGQYEYLIPIPGSRKLSRIKENTSAADIDFAKEDLKALTDALDHLEIAGNRF